MLHAVPAEIESAVLIARRAEVDRLLSVAAGEAAALTERRTRAAERLAAREREMSDHCDASSCARPSEASKALLEEVSREAMLAEMRRDDLRTRLAAARERASASPATAVFHPTYPMWPSGDGGAGPATLPRAEVAGAAPVQAVPFTPVAAPAAPAAAAPVAQPAVPGAGGQAGAMMYGMMTPYGFVPVPVAASGSMPAAMMGGGMMGGPMGGAMMGGAVMGGGPMMGMGGMPYMMMPYGMGMPQPGGSAAGGSAAGGSAAQPRS